MNKALQRADYTTVRFSELVRLRQADLELTELRQAMQKILTQGQRDDLSRAIDELDSALPF